MHGCRAQVLVAAGYVELGPRLKRSNLEYVILQGSHFHHRKWRRALQRCSRRPGLVPRWTGWRLILCPNDYFQNTCEVRSQCLERISRGHVLSNCMRVARNGRSAQLRGCCTAQRGCVAAVRAGAHAELLHRVPVRHLSLIVRHFAGVVTFPVMKRAAHGVGGGRCLSIDAARLRERGAR